MSFRSMLVLALVAVCCGSVLAWDVKDLQGKWVITSVNGEDDGDRSDAWEFRKNQWIVWTGNTRLPPDPFELKGDTIDLGYGKIKILELTKDRMRTEQSGFTYTFERVD